MGNRLTKIYTRTGDTGTTGLADGSRVDKASLRIDALGDIDEVNSLLGLLIAEDLNGEISSHLRKIQHALFDLGGEVSLVDSIVINADQVQFLEQLIDQFNEPLPALKEFILPGGNRAAATCHLARSVCRRAERQLVRLEKTGQVNQLSLVYLNRLSDLLFVFCRVLARQEGGKEICWDKSL